MSGRETSGAFDDVVLYFGNDDDWDEIVLSEGHDVDQSQRGKYGDKRTLKSLLSHKVESTVRNLREREDPFGHKVYGAHDGEVLLFFHSPFSIFRCSLFS